MHAKSVVLLTDRLQDVVSQIAQFALRLFWLLRGCQDSGWHGREIAHLDVSERGGLQHLVELGERVGVAGGGGGEHDEAEAGWDLGGNAVFVGDEFEDDELAAGFEGGVEAFEEGDVGGGVEVVEEVGEQDDVVVLAEVDVEGAAGEELVAIEAVEPGGVFFGDVEDGGPVLSGDGGARVLLEEGEAEHAVAGGDVEDFERGVVGVGGEDLGGEEFGGHELQAGHAAGELDPGVVVGVEDAVPGEGCAAGADAVGEFVEAVADVGGVEEFDGGSDVGGGFLVEERGRVGGEGVAVFGFGEETEGDEEVGEDACAALCDAAVGGDFVGGFWRGADGGEEAQFDGGLEGGGFLVGVDGVEEQFGGGMVGHGRPFRWE